MDACPPENDIAELAAGLLRGDRRARLEAHLDECAACRDIVADVLAALSQLPEAATEKHSDQDEADAAATFVSPQRGQHVGRYVILEWLGEGGMGAVFRARDTILQREVALKVFDPRRRAARRVLREARAAAAIEHPHIVSTFDVDEVHGVPFLAMELVSGRTLRKHIVGSDGSYDERIAWLRAMASALAAAHARGVVHRDVKPENVIVRDDGLVKVLDFGLARMAQEAAITTRGAIVGTPIYMAPEQLRGEAADARSDQFAWGIVAYELLSGEHPFGNGALEERLAKIGAKDAAPKLDAPLAIAKIVARALAKDPTARFESMDAVVTALDRLEAPRSVALPDAPESKAWLGAFVLAALAILAVAFVPAQAAPKIRAVGSDKVMPRRNPEALEKYRLALHAFRGASLDEASELLGEAIAIDGTFAAAHLRLALLADSAGTEMHAHLQHAQQFRSTLDDADAALLFAIEPWATEPSDAKEAERRLVVAVGRYPDVALFWYVLGWTRFQMNAYDGALHALAKARAYDWEFAPALALEGDIYALTSAPESAQRAYDQCLTISSSSTRCLLHLATLAERAGRCFDEEALLTRVVALHAQSIREYTCLASVRYVLGRGDRAVEDAIALVLTHASLHAAHAAELELRAKLDILYGNFREADLRLKKQIAAVANETEEWAHIVPYRNRMLVALETGRNADAIAIADDYLARSVGWTPTDLLWSTEIYAIEVKYRAGGLKPAEARAARDAWLARERERRTKANGYGPAYLWLASYAHLAITPTDAREALDALPRLGPLPSLDTLGSNANLLERLGEVYLLAGLPEKAVEPLSRAASACTALFYPFYPAQAALHLGEAHEAQGDARRACDAYRGVIARWGDAQPRSTTVSKARAALARLRCEASPPWSSASVESAESAVAHYGRLERASAARKNRCRGCSRRRSAAAGLVSGVIGRRREHRLRRLTRIRLVSGPKPASDAHRSNCFAIQTKLLQHPPSLLPSKVHPRKAAVSPGDVSTLAHPPGLVPSTQRVTTTIRFAS